MMVLDWLRSRPSSSTKRGHCRAAAAADVRGGRGRGRRATRAWGRPAACPSARSTHLREGPGLQIRLHPRVVYLRHVKLHARSGQRELDGLAAACAAWGVGQIVGGHRALPAAGSGGGGGGGGGGRACWRGVWTSPRIWK